MTVAPDVTRPLVACDLDRTLIYSAAALGLGGPDAAAPPLVVAEVYQGVPISFLTRRAETLLAELAQIAVFVPTTTRTVAQYERVRLFQRPPAFAVTTNGAQIVVDGRPDGDWTVEIAARLTSACAPLADIADHLAKLDDPRWTLSRRVAEDVFCYLVVNRAELPATFVSDLAEWCEPLGWTVSLQGRKIYAVPRPLTKSAALAEVVRRSGATCMFGAGDSLLDADLLEAAQYGVRPAHGELADLGWQRDHVAVTSATGILAAEEILNHLLVACGR
ncbi:HAD family hydrolase [Sporichthya sp.]|uniref:HAD family hydrolase n=1 Tax=Sporichthya sp. TaxID=65475 RepID=UPI0017AD338A|nr:HAD family hydrolase [Sporichthya sp.]MBA3743851.1 HAD family hydrolase [Sporichthya sp.]